MCLTCTRRSMSLLCDRRGFVGASLGKALCGFRVVTETGARPRIARAPLRADSDCKATGTRGRHASLFIRGERPTSVDQMRGTRRLVRAV
jgi:hypothetical protein